jgi:hypothetical protein
MGIIDNFNKHEKFVRQELSDDKSGEELKDLLAYHQSQIQNFQHERLIHLLVTLFFGLANLIVFSITLAFPRTEMLFLDIILLIVLVFYIKHYFVLENGIQRMYGIDREIAEKI